MSDALILKERIKNSILLGESDFREFKSALEGKPGYKKSRLVKMICRDIAEALVAFANTDGGEIIIGVEDDGTISGVPHQENDLKAMLNAPISHVYKGKELPIVYKIKINIESKTLLFFQVDKSLSNIYQLGDGRVVGRQKRETVPIAVKKRQLDQEERISREYDRRLVDGAQVADLDIDLIQGLADDYLNGLTVEKYLQQVGLAEYTVNGLRLTKAAILLFSKNKKWLFNSRIRFMKINGTELLSGEQYNVISDEYIEGNIYTLIYKSWETIRPYLAYKTDYKKGRFEQKYIYPEEACREALINAIAHRDYNRHNSVEVHIYNDRMEIKSPGPLLSTITIKDLESLSNRHESRNIKIANTLKISKLMREAGEGMKRIFTLIRQNELQKPKLYSNTVWFTVTLFNKSVFDSTQQAFLNLFIGFPLTTFQKRILIAGMNEKELSPENIYQALNTKDRNTYDKEVTQLREYRFLSEIRTNSQANLIAKRNKIPKQKIARFKVSIPKIEFKKLT